MEKAYAQALWNAIAGGADHQKAVHAMQQMLKAQGREALMPRIAKAFERLAAHESARSTLTLVIADKHHEAHARKEAIETLKKLGIDTQTIETRTDESLIGGWRLEGQEHLVDASYKKHLLAIYQAATI